MVFIMKICPYCGWWENLDDATECEECKKDISHVLPDCNDQSPNII